MFGAPRGVVLTTGDLAGEGLMPGRAAQRGQSREEVGRPCAPRMHFFQDFTTLGVQPKLGRDSRSVIRRITPGGSARSCTNRAAA